MRAIGLIAFLFSALACSAQPAWNSAFYGQLYNVMHPIVYAAPYAVPTNAYGWWHADSMTAGNGDQMPHWPDSAGANDLWVWGADTAHSPHFTNSALNGLPAVYWTHSSHQALTNNFGTTLTQPVTVIFVVNLQNISAGTPYLFDGYGSTTREVMLSVNGGGILYSNEFGNGPVLVLGPSGLVTNLTYVLTICYNNTQTFMRTNGVLYALGPGGTSGNAGFSLGDRYDDATVNDPFNGLVHEVIMYKGLPATNDIQWVENGLGTKYGISMYH